MRTSDAKAQFRRLAAIDRPVLICAIDGAEVEALEGDTVLTAILVRQRAVRTFEFDSQPRAGFCLMGACQDCWVGLAGRRRVRACTTPVSAGMQITTTAVTAALQPQSTQENHDALR